MKTLFRFLFTIIGMVALGSCGDTSEEYVTGDYFPLEKNRQWSYERELISSGDDHDAWIHDTVTFFVDTDTTYEGKVYTKIRNEQGDTERIIRKENSKYYSLGLYAIFSETDQSYQYKENLFLDTSKPVGYRWTNYDVYFRAKTEYTIMAKKTEQEIAGIVYKDVIQIEVNYYTREVGAFNPWLTTTHYYAKDVGEIYNYYPYPLSFYYADSRRSLIKTTN